jgi:hypothetical protein
MTAREVELARLKAENAALWEVHAACVKALDDLDGLARTPAPTSHTEAIGLILACLTPIAAVLDADSLVKAVPSEAVAWVRDEHSGRIKAAAPVPGSAPAVPANEAAAWVYDHLRCPIKAEPKGCSACLNDAIEIVHGIYFPGVAMPDRGGA